MVTASCSQADQVDHLITPLMIMNKQTLLIVAALAAAPSSAIAATIVDVDFSSGLENLVKYATATDASNPVVGSSTGVGSPAGAGVTMGADGWLVNDTAMTIASEISFSVDGKYRASVRGSNAGLAFGWAQGGATSVYNATTAQTITVGVTNVTQGNYRLSVAGGIASHGTSGFGTTTPVALTVNNWYRLSGTILFDGGTNTFTFNDIGFYDLGSDGLGTATQLLSGTGETLTNAAWTGATTGQVGVITNQQRGFQVLDNIYAAEPIPEPSAALLGGLGALVLLRRRRA